ncbi:MAG TPA: TIGR01841 family phasin [Alphaproteobacteria bacterium]|nr:TIGR01841 family phasin [Alphaproteobacteria bacterium]
MAKTTFTPFTEVDFTKFLGEFKLPGVNTEQLVESYRKNVEAFAAASQLAVEGVQAVAKRQVEILRDAAEECSKHLRGLAAPASAEDAAAKQAEFAKQSFETSLARVRELSEIIARSSSASLEVLNKRAAEALEELKALAPKPMAKAA